MNTLQSFVFPNLEVRAHEEMYVRLNDKAWPDLRGARVHFAAGGILSSDTFFNGFTVGTWKRRCDIRSLSLRIAGAGEFVLTFGLHRYAQTSVWLDEHHFTLEEGDNAELPLPAWREIADGMLFYRVRALGRGTIREAAFETPDVPPNDVRLGVVITHFNRQAQVMPAIRRIEKGVLERADLRGRVTLTVVDNSRNLPLAPHPAVDHILNRNLGGTGGFVRGLLSLIDGGECTHALFMDDDASCETESIARSFALLQYAREQRLAIAGALLREMAPWDLLEKGARFDGKVVPLNAGLDMRRVPDLIEAERDLVRPDYGAWWFFAFPIAEARRFPFPFFVRGDDVFFGLGNAFDIVTLNGVACLGEDFSAKHGPMTAYLDARYHLVHALLAERDSASRIVWVGSRLFVKALTSYHYSSARAVTLAMQHTLAGPAFFRDNLDMQAVRSEVAGWLPSERLLPIERPTLDAKGARRRPESKVRRLLRALTLQGFLLPGWLLLDRMTVQAKGFHGSASAVFRYRRVLYEHVHSGTGFIAEFDRPRFFAALGGFLKAWSSCFGRLPALRRDYVAGAREMASIEFWRSVYPEASAAGDAERRRIANGAGRELDVEAVGPEPRKPERSLARA